MGVETRPPASNPRGRARRATIQIAACLLTSACAHVESVESFARSAGELAAASSEFYELQLATDRRLARFSVDLARHSFSDAVGEGGLIAEARRHRAAVGTLASYAHSLERLAAANFDDVERESHRLAESLRAFATSLDRAQTDEAALADAIEALALMYVRLRQSRAIYALTRAAQPHLEVVLETVIDDVRRQSQRHAVAKAAASATREEWFRALQEDVERAPQPERALRSIAAAQLVEAELRDLAADAPRRAFVAQLDATARSCLRAHAAIGAPELKDRAELLADFVADVRALVSALRRLRGSWGDDGAP